MICSFISLFDSSNYLVSSPSCSFSWLKFLMIFFEFKWVSSNVAFSSFILLTSLSTAAFPCSKTATSWHRYLRAAFASAFALRRLSRSWVANYDSFLRWAMSSIGSFDLLSSLQSCTSTVIFRCIGDLLWRVLLFTLVYCGCWRWGEKNPQDCLRPPMKEWVFLDLLFDVVVGFVELFVLGWGWRGVILGS